MPWEACVPIPIISKMSSALLCPTMAITLEVPMSNPTIMLSCIVPMFMFLFCFRLGSIELPCRLHNVGPHFRAAAAPCSTDAYINPQSASAYAHTDDDLPPIEYRH